MSFTISSDKKPASLKICALIDKKGRREISVNVDYSGFEIKEGFLVGYGLDYADHYRNLQTTSKAALAVVVISLAMLGLVGVRARIKPGFIFGLGFPVSLLKAYYRGQGRGKIQLRPCPGRHHGQGSQNRGGLRRV